MKRWAKYAVPMVVCVVLVGTPTQSVQAFPGGRILRAIGRGLAAPVRAVRASRRVCGRAGHSCSATCNSPSACGNACVVTVPSQATVTSIPETPPPDPHSRFEAP